MATNNTPVLKVDALLPDNRGWTNRFEIKSSSSSSLYTVAQHQSGRHWGCSCKGWIYHANRRCKHLRGIAKGLGLNEEALCGQKPYEINVIAANSVAALPSTPAKAKPVRKARKPRTSKPATPATVVEMKPATAKAPCASGCACKGDIKKLRSRLVRLVDLSETVAEEGLPEFTALENEIEALRNKIRELRAAV